MIFDRRFSSSGPGESSLDTRGKESSATEGKRERE